MSEWAPNVSDVMIIYKRIAMQCEPEFNGGDGFEVTESPDKYCIRLEKE